MTTKCSRKGVKHPESTELVSVAEEPGPWNTGWEPCGANWEEAQGNVLGIIGCAHEGVDLGSRSPLLGTLPCGVCIFWEWDTQSPDRFQTLGTISIEIGEDTTKTEIACAAQAALDCREYVSKALLPSMGNPRFRRPSRVADWVQEQREEGLQFSEIAYEMWSKWLTKLQTHRNAGPNPFRELRNGLKYREIQPDRMLRNEVFGELLCVFGRDVRGQSDAIRMLELADEAIDGEKNSWTGTHLEKLSKALAECVRPPRK